MSNPTSPVFIPDDEELLLRLRNFEDNFVERKTTGDYKDWLKTAVAFANTAPPGFPCILYVGFKNDGTPEDTARQPNLEELQKSVDERLMPAYPYIIRYHRVFRIGDKRRLAVIIPGSEQRPHFTQRPHLRKGAQSAEATDDECEMLLAYRNSKAAWVLRWKGKQITVSDSPNPSVGQGRTQTIYDCNQFFVTLQSASSAKYAVPLNRVEISHDYGQDRLQLNIPDLRR
jgi:hypothetical protein